MKSIVINDVGGVDVLEQVELPQPSRPQGSVLVKVHSTWWVLAPPSCITVAVPHEIHQCREHSRRIGSSAAAAAA